MTDDRQKVTWQAESTHPELAQAVDQALRQVYDPEIGLSIIELGLVRDLEIQDQSANLLMILTTPFCPYGPALLEMARQKVESVVKRSTTIELGMEMWEPAMMEEGAASDWGLF
jgi:metal-sulfur cluster biosynthetic enzyme